MATMKKPDEKRGATHAPSRSGSGTVAAAAAAPVIAPRASAEASFVPVSTVSSVDAYPAAAMDFRSMAAAHAGGAWGGSMAVLSSAPPLSASTSGAFPLAAVPSAKSAALPHTFTPSSKGLAVTAPTATPILLEDDLATFLSSPEAAHTVDTNWKRRGGAMHDRLALAHSIESIGALAVIYTHTHTHTSPRISAKPALTDRG